MAAVLRDRVDVAWLRRRVGGAILAISLLAPFPVGAQPSPDGSTATVGTAQLSGLVVSGATPLDGYAVTLYVTNGVDAPSVLGTTLTDAGGAFGLDPTVPVPPEGVVYVVAESPIDGPLPVGARTLASVLGVGAIPEAAVVNELTTVATAYAMAQFIGDGTVLAGPSPGLQNAAGMAHNLADPTTAADGEVLATVPNGGDTTTRDTFHSLANMVAACVASTLDCDALFTAATTPEGVEPESTLRALTNIAHDPWHDARRCSPSACSGRCRTNLRASLRPRRGHSPSASTATGSRSTGPATSRSTTRASSG
jgi:hypothetical protein